MTNANPDASVAGCWFHYAQAIIKRTNKIGLKECKNTDDSGADLTCDFLLDALASSSQLVDSVLTGLCSRLVSSLPVSLIT